ncbi:hypothetical protein [Parvularcula dongshanensis]|uniref:Lipoprotein SmpA/OmlA domain-containing protein n=1 Tax=Parvularcula dongshanensis TaxID=1173995 RepID=A0A840I5B5_9PROT|nr:hypothetical protein [Parvularcula dongshanensis]MBB4659977.1 hypothetical protein [Parvularcula dongshanensis]
MSFPRALAASALLATLAACATGGSEAPIPTPNAAAPTTAPPAPPLVMRGPSADSFLGRPVADLEAVLGEPALTRSEGRSEFRRYDVGADCRAYAVVTPPGGAVASLTTGPATRGEDAPAFEDCTARTVSQDEVPPAPVAPTR